MSHPPRVIEREKDILGITKGVVILVETATELLREALTPTEQVNHDTNLEMLTRMFGEESAKELVFWYYKKRQRELHDKHR